MSQGPGEMSVKRTTDHDGMDQSAPKRPKVGEQFDASDALKSPSSTIQQVAHTQVPKQVPEISTDTPFTSTVDQGDSHVFANLAKTITATKESDGADDVVGLRECDDVKEQQDQMFARRLISQRTESSSSQQHSFEDTAIQDDIQRALVASIQTFEEERVRDGPQAVQSEIGRIGDLACLGRTSSPSQPTTLMGVHERYDEYGNIIMKSIKVNGVLVHKAFTAAGNLIEDDACKANLFLEIGKLRGDIGDENSATIQGKKVVHWKVLATTENIFNKEDESEQVFVRLWVSRLATPVYLENQQFFGPPEMFLHQAMTDSFGRNIPVRFYPASPSIFAGDDASDNAGDSAFAEDDAYKEDDLTGGVVEEAKTLQVDGRHGEHETRDKGKGKALGLPQPAGLFLKRDASFFFSPKINTIDFTKQCSIDDVTLERAVKDGATAVFRGDLGRYDNNKKGTTRAIKKFVADTLGTAAVLFNHH